MAEYAGVLVLHEGRVLLVREHYPTWGGPHWNVPSGRLDGGESPAEGGARELLEETGVRVAPAALRLVSTVEVRRGGARSTCWNFTTTVADAALRPDDPDGIVEAAAWFARDEAARLLAALPYDPIRVPALDFLATRRTGVAWVADDRGVRQADSE